MRNLVGAWAESTGPEGFVAGDVRASYAWLVEAVAVSGSVLGPAGARVRGREFHRSACTLPAGRAPAWQWAAGSGPEGFVAGGVRASYARRLVEAVG